MTPERRNIYIIGAIAIAVILVAVNRSGILTSARTRERAATSKTEAIALGQRAYGPIKTVELSSLVSSAAVREVLRSASVRPTTDPVGAGSKTDNEAIEQLAAELVYYRYLQPSVDEYKRWRRSAGFKLMEGIRLRKWYIDQDYKTFFGVEYPGDDKIEEVFDRFWTAGLELKDGSSLPVAIATEAKGLGIAYGELRPESESNWPHLAGELTEGEWHGLSAGSYRTWWEDPGGGVLGEMKRHGRVRVAVMGMIMQFKKGDRYPLRLFAYQNAGDKRWWLGGVGVLNADPGRFNTLEF